MMSAERLAVQRCGRRQAGPAILYDVPAATTSVSNGLFGSSRPGPPRHDPPQSDLGPWDRTGLRQACPAGWLLFPRDGGLVETGVPGNSPGYRGQFGRVSGCGCGLRNLGYRTGVCSAKSALLLPILSVARTPVTAQGKGRQRSLRTVDSTPPLALWASRPQ